MHRFALASLALALGACGSSGEESGAGSNPVVVDTSTAAARAQYDANVAFALRYRAKCVTTGAASDRPRVLVAGFGRVFGEPRNSAGLLVSTLVSAAKYPMTTAPGDGKVDPPEPQLSVGVSTIDLPLSGKVEACGMVLPASWDLTAVLVSKEIESFRPDFVMMNGIAHDRQHLWIELGAVNRALSSLDESNLRPAPAAGETFAPLVKADPLGNEQALLLSYGRVRAAAERARREIVAGADGEEFGTIMRGVAYPKYPRPSGNYLCNNLSYVTSWLMSHPGDELTLLEASVPKKGAVNAVPARIEGDFRATPRVFVHWPADVGGHLERGARVMASMIDAQLSAASAGQPPTLGKTSMADIDPSNGSF